MNWDDLRYALALTKAGSLVRAAKALGVDHTTVARRIDALEAALGQRLFTRTTTGYVLTSEGERLVPELEAVERGASAIERRAHAADGAAFGTVRVTAGETFGIRYLAPRLARLGQRHPGLEIELVTGGAVLDLARREADVAVRFFKSKSSDLVVRRAGSVAHALYATKTYLSAHPLKKGDLRGHAILGAAPGSGVVEAAWLDRIGVRASFVSNMTAALLEAALADAGIAVLPRYLGDADRRLRRLARADEPEEPIWITVHRDLRQNQRVRVVLDFLVACLEHDRKLLAG